MGHPPPRTRHAVRSSVLSGCNDAVQERQRRAAVSAPIVASSWYMPRALGFCRQKSASSQYYVSRIQLLLLTAALQAQSLSARRRCRWKSVPQQHLRNIRELHASELLTHAVHVLRSSCSCAASLLAFPVERTVFAPDRLTETAPALLTGSRAAWLTSPGLMHPAQLVGATLGEGG